MLRRGGHVYKPKTIILSPANTSRELLRQSPMSDRPREPAKSTARELPAQFHFRADRLPATKLFMATQLKIGFLGAGKMATALASGFVRAEIAFPKEIMRQRPASAPREKSLPAKSARKPPRQISTSPKFANILILATKPDQVAAALAEISGAFTKNHLLISIAAGVTLAKLEAALARRRARHPRHAQHARAGRRRRVRVCARAKMQRLRMANWQKNFCPPSASRFK